MAGIRYLLILLISGSLTSAALGQSISMEGFVGYGTYGMNDLKKVLQVHLEAVDLPVRITEDFPAYVNGGFQFGFYHDDFETGLRFGHYSTGGRVHYRDYSGEYSFNVTINAYTSGVHTRMTFFENERIQLKGAVAGLACFSYGKLENYMVVNGKKQSSVMEVASTSFVLEPSLVPTFKVSDMLYIGATLGVALDIGGGLNVAGDRKAKLFDDNEDPITSNWSGLRTAILLGINF